MPGMFSIYLFISAVYSLVVAIVREAKLAYALRGEGFSRDARFF